MRELVLQMTMISMDGYICEEGTEFWRICRSMPEADVDEEFGDYFLAGLRQAGTHIMGRTTYLSMAQAWPNSADAEAPLMNNTPKVVFSRTLTTADWLQSRIASGDTAAEVAKLKQEPGGEILAHGGAKFAQSLARLGLVDQYRLYVYPVAAGGGAPLFTDTDGPRRLRLVASKAFRCGVLALTYRPAG
jgi:dihydrofolate reductase